MRKTRHLFKKIRDTKGIFHAKMGTIKDRNGMDLTEAEDIKKVAGIHRRTIQKRPYDSDTPYGVITHIEANILKCKVKWALGRITMSKARGGDEIPDKLSQILKVVAFKVLNSKCQPISQTQHWPQDWKKSVFIPIPNKSNAKKKSSKSHRTAFFSHASKIMLQIF